jgi:hypothetical protein
LHDNQADFLTKSEIKSGDGTRQTNCVLSSAPATAQSIVLSLRETPGSKRSYVNVLAFGRGQCKIELADCQQGASITEMAHGYLTDF